jgi:ABC-2 type transport system permease protein
LSQFMQAASQAMTIARRDVTWKIGSPFFLIALFAPLMMIIFAGLVGMGSERAVKGTISSVSIVAVAEGDYARRIGKADVQLRKMMPADNPLPPLRVTSPSKVGTSPGESMIKRSKGEVVAVLEGTEAAPSVIIVSSGNRMAHYLVRVHELATETKMRTDRMEAIGVRKVRTAGIGTVGRTAFGQIAITMLFLMTYFLCSQVSGSMIEERSNKTIDTLAAAAPMESIFFGKLAGEFAIAMIFVGFYGSLLALLPAFLPEGAGRTLSLVARETGWGFAVLFVAYFTTAYMIQSAAIIGVSSLASTPYGARVIMIPLSALQFAMMTACIYAFQHPGSGFHLATALFPMTSPMLMLGESFREMPTWRHVAAIAWQVMWLVILLRFSARAFRRTALDSGPPGGSGKSKRKTA